MIINIRGTHGSGKSTLVRSLLDRYGASVDGSEKKPLGYRFQPEWLSKPVYVVGFYRTACGGCDLIHPYDRIWPRVAHYAELGHVIFEGALISGNYGSIGRASERYGDQFVFAFMTTPLEVCIERVRRRRLAKGDTRPFNTKNTESKFNAIRSLIVKIRAMGRRVAMLDYRRPIPQLLGLLLSAN